MSKLSDQQVQFIRLILRSPDIGNRWRVVSKGLRAHTRQMVGEQPELYDLENNGEQMLIRLSDEGIIVSQYI